MLVNKVDIKVSAGKGGKGLASFRREKFEPFGGPDGGDGGKGGDVYILADSNLEDLSGFRHKFIFKAGCGGGGRKNKMKGENAEDLVLRVPVGTTVYVKKEGHDLLMADLEKNGQKVLIAKGGKGGRGNVHFATATRKAPKIFQKGEDGEEYELVLKLKLMTDICIIGYPNSGKSTLLAGISGAKPLVAEYPFTTREPVPAVVDDGRASFIWMELPAIVEGSHRGKGLGNEFLNHAQRACVLVYLLDAASADIARELQCLQEEVLLFDGKLGEKKSIIAVNKIDSVDSSTLESIKTALGSESAEIIMVSARDRRGLEELVSAVHNMAGREKAVMQEQPHPQVVFRPKPVDR